MSDNKVANNKRSSGNNAAEAATSAAAAADSLNSSEDNTCVVCFKNVDIYSIGECDHPVCYECSTRMRVLCQQNECPICRQVLSKVIFTCEKQSYRELEAKNRSEYYSKKYKICFYTNKIQQAFFDLLDHQCPKCNAQPYRTFNGLKGHVSREHNLHYCDLCTEHLKIFTFERRCYTQTELGLHRVKGDVDNKSHRGHPLCEYCNCRYLDRDELFRHLRRDHYFCHFCDADGYNDFYKDYDALAEHFRQDHYLCEEGKCATEQFTGAFRTEIDYKAHVANVHGKSLNKQQVKQARTLQLEITLGRRGRTGQPEQGIANVRGGRGNENHYEEPDEMMYMEAQQNHHRTIDAQNEQDFPSLAGAGGPAMSLARPALISMRNRNGTAGLARTKENFPALGGGGAGFVAAANGVAHSQQQQRQPPPISNMIKKSPSAATGAISRTTASTSGNNGNATGMVIHVSNRPTSETAHFPALPPGKSKRATAAAPPPLRRPEETKFLQRTTSTTSSSSAASKNGLNKSTQPKAKTLDFPVLHAGKSKKQSAAAATATRLIDEDMLPSGVQLPMANVSAKHRLLVDDYVSVANPSNFQKLQMVKQEEQAAHAKRAAAELNAPKLTTFDFPTLGGGGGGVANIVNSSKTSTWTKTNTEKKQREVENRKSKVAPAPILPKHSNNKSATATTNNNLHNEAAGNNAASKKDKKQDKQKKSASVSPVDTKTNNNNNNTNNKINKEKNNNNENKPENANVNESATAPVLRPPPGFGISNSSTMKPPPGFQSNIIVNSVAKPANNLTFTSSLGETYSIMPTHAYMQPPESITRNQKLVSHFKESLSTPEALDEFRQISTKFREGVYKAQAYYEHCQAALKDKFDPIFPELLALLPDISKQQALYLVHSQRILNLPTDQRKSLPNLEVCSTCKQVLLAHDLENHKKLHNIKDNFPSLGAGNGKAAVGNRK